MKVTVPVMVKDPEVSNFKEVGMTESFTIEDEEFFLDGPITRRVAILDFDPATGRITPGARFRPAKNESHAGSYELPEGIKLDDPAFIQVSTFGGVYKTIKMFEEADTLGRRVEWAFPGSQLLVVPRAGECANAFYERDSRSLQLFFFTPQGSQTKIYTCHSQDIIAHETAHAIIDGVAPDLYHSMLPEGLAIHESIADLATLMMAFRSRELAAAVLKATQGSIASPSVFTAIAEQFATALGRKGFALREINNQHKLSDVDPTEPHALSVVLSGALYQVMIKIYNELYKAPEEEESPNTSSEIVKAEYRQWAQSAEPAARKAREGNRHGTAPGRALYIASERFKRTILRALDYLPPGEVSFADFARALLASDKASHPESESQREWLCKEFVERRIVSKSSELDIETNFERPEVTQLDLDELLHSDWLAYQFANNNREWLGVPRDIPFEVRPRLDVKKKYYHKGDEPRFVRECLFKVLWNETEPNSIDSGLPSRRRFIRGTTLAIDWESKKIRAVVTSLNTKAMRNARSEFLARLIKKDALHIDESAAKRAHQPMRSSVRGEIIDGVLRVRATANTLHLLAEY